MKKTQIFGFIALIYIVTLILGVNVSLGNLKAQLFATHTFTSWEDFEIWMSSEGKTYDDIESRKTLSDGGEVVIIDGDVVVVFN